MALSLETLRQIDDLQAYYVDALDRQDMQRWLSAFDQESSYICRTAESEDAGLPISLILDDCYERIQDRVKFVTEVWAGTYQPYRTRHVVQRLSCKADGGALFRMHSNFIITWTSTDGGRTEMFASGVYQDEILVAGDSARFRSKRVIIDAPILPHYNVFPL